MNIFYFSLQKALLYFFLLAGFVVTHAQNLQVTSGSALPYTPQNLISNIFLGEGVDVTSITYAGKPEAVGYFNGGAQAIGLERGIVLTTGLVESSGSKIGCNEQGSDFASTDNGLNAGDPDLDLIATDNLHDVTVYTIKFIPTSDTLRFRYCFASEEYPEYSCSNFNDVFGFFIQGPGYPSPTNIAKVPGTSLPVSISNVHPSYGLVCASKNVQYFNGNNNTNKQPTYDGFTDVFTAQAIVTPCQEYTIKLAIADVSDGVWDSGVFLEAKSFGTSSLKVEVTTVGADATLTEGCAEGTMTFSIPIAPTQNLPIDYNVWGTALSGTDYQTIPTGLFIPAGQKQITVPLIALADNLVENGEFIAVDVQRDPCHRDTIYIKIRDNDILPPSLRPDTTVCQSNLQPLELNGTLPITLPPPPSFTNTQDYPVSSTSPSVFSPITVSGLLQKKVVPGVIRSVCLNIDHQFDDDLEIYLISPSGQFVELSTDNGANGMNYTNTCFTPTATQKINFPGQQAPASAAPFTGDFLPEGPWEDLYGDNPTNGVWKLQVTDDANGFTGTLRDWTITFEPTYELTYQWSPLDSVACASCPITTVNPSQTTLYTLLATDSYGCAVQDSMEVEVRPALAAPTITCGNSSSNSVSFDWSNVAGATGYEVNVNGSGWTAPSDSLAHTITGLAPSSTVNMEVRALGGLADCPAYIGTATCVNCQSPTATLNATGVSCAGSANGSLTVTPDGQNPPYTFQAGSQTSATGNFQNLTAGSYTVTVTDPSGCEGYFPAIISTPDSIFPNISLQQNVSCFGGNNGILATAAIGGTGTLSYQWNDPADQTTASAANLVIGNYTVTVTDANGCTATATASVIQPTDLLLSTVVTNAKCFNQPTGAVEASGIGGTEPYQFAWSSGPPIALNNNILSGSYTVTITDVQGCTKTSTALVGQPAQLAATTTVIAANCNGSADGSATAIPQGGTGPYSFLWNDAQQQNTAVATGLPAQSFVVIVTDANGCTVNQNAVVSAPAPLALALSKTNSTCDGSANGTATVAATGGTGPYSYKWNDTAGQTAALATGLLAGSYVVTVTDAHDCTSTSSIVISEPAAIQITPTATAAACFGSATGRIDLAVQGGTSPFTFAWSSGEGTQNITQKPADNYLVTVTDANGCTATAQENIGQPTEIQWTSTEKPVLCKTGNTGEIKLTATGGTPGYTLAWLGPNGFSSSGMNLQNLLAGNYAATLTDAAGCTRSVAQVVTEPASALALALPEFADTICFAATNGQATVVATGGATPYTYLWNAGSQTTATATGLVSQPYAVTVTDKNNCIQTAETYIIQKEQIFALAEKVDPLCYNGRDGKARVAVIYYGSDTAALNTFSYLWNTTPPQTNVEADGLSANGNYTVTVVDALGCTAERAVTLSNPYPVVGRVDSLASVQCHGDTNGWAVASGSGGTAPYTYFWSPGPSNQADSMAQNLAAGQYRVTVTDAHGCPATVSATIVEPPTLDLNLLVTDVQCFGNQDGSVKAVVSGGVAPYTYVWLGGQTGPEVKNLPAGTFSLSLADANGCLMRDSVQIAQPATPVSGSYVHQGPRCFGGHDGSVTLTGAGGTPPYRYALDQEPWNGSPRQIGLLAGGYQPKIIDRNGCVLALQPVEITQPAAVVVDLGPDILIELGRDTQLLANVTNATGAVRFVWTAADSVWLSCLTCARPLVEDLMYQHYFYVQVTDALGCQGEDRVLVTVEKPRRIHVPTGFTPNDDQQNDRLLVHGQKTAHILDFRVYDRWGELVFEQKDFAVNDPDAGWDGSFRDSPLDPGTYVWVLQVVYMDGEKEVLKGHTTLIR